MTLRCQRELLCDSRTKFALFSPFPAECRWCVPFAEPCVCWDDGPVPLHRTSAEGTSPPQTFCCRVPRRCLAVLAHMMLGLFLREQLCPRRHIPALSVWTAACRHEMGCSQKAVCSSLHFVPGEPGVQLLLP